MSKVSATLEEEFRLRVIEIADGLTIEDCEKIAFFKKLPKSTYLPEPGRQNVRLNILGALEAYGHIHPANPDALMTILKNLPREDLVHIVEKYKQSPLFKKTVKPTKKKSSKKPRKDEVEGGSLEQQLPSLKAGSADDLLAIKEMSEKQNKQQVLALIITHVNHMMKCAQLLHLSIANDSQIDDTEFREVAKGGERFSREMHKMLSAIGIASTKESTSSEESETCTDDRQSPEAPRKMPLLPPLPPEFNGSPRSIRKPNKPTPLPRKKLAETKSCQETSSTTDKSVQHVPLLVHTTARLHQPDHAESSTDDYTGTGDSGVDVAESWGITFPPAQYHDGNKQEHPAEDHAYEWVESGHKYIQIKAGAVKNTEYDQPRS